MQWPPKIQNQGNLLRVAGCLNMFSCACWDDREIRYVDVRRIPFFMGKSVALRKTQVMPACLPATTSEYLSPQAKIEFAIDNSVPVH